MIVGGVWVLGEGDRSPEIPKTKAFMRRMYASYADHLANTELYDQETVIAVTETRLGPS
jgi:hypothetical protein